jgi:hypothetical protein
LTKTLERSGHAILVDIGRGLEVRWGSRASERRSHDNGLLVTAPAVLCSCTGRNRSIPLLDASRCILQIGSKVLIYRLLRTEFIVRSSK